MASLALIGARKAYPGGAEALRGVDLAVADGELMVLVGPSGCGKTTALRAIAGLERLTDGTVEIDGEDVGALEPAARDVAMVFQSYALYPSMTVARNLSFGLRARGVARAERDRRVREIARLLELEELLDRRPRQLSGGQRQRVAMGRAIVREPRAFLMDEPLSNLDARLRVQMRGEIVRLQARLGATMVYVTHDQVEALTMGRRVAVMDAGRIRQCDTPAALYERPADTFVARFIGSPPASLLRGRLGEGRDGELECVIGGVAVALGAGAEAARPALRAAVGGELVVGVPADGFALAPGGAAGIPGTVALAELLGAETLVHVELAGAGEGGAAATVVGRFGRGVAAVPGDPVAVALVPDRLDYFDPETGLALDRPAVA
ncbi:MAG: ATP-binding cassette domain-containing protein [Solirubrobacterales bacterium]|nr:ATP-binding cassette domain-containing protein [Solirubrobacterales bacterium]